MTALVLVIEDNPINAELVVTLLEALGYRTLTAADGLEGLEAARRQAPDLILCDVQMPVLDGCALARIAKADAQLRAIPLLALTASAMVGDRDRILAAGFDNYIAKPIDPQTFALRMGQLLPVGAPDADAPPTVAGAATTAGAGRPAGAARRGTVLILDDTAFNRELKRDLLEPHGWQVRTASSIAEAVALAQRERPDLIISDVGLPDGSGLDFLAVVKADPRLATVPFVFLTATHWDRNTELSALARGADAYLRRPMDAAELLAALETYATPR